MGTKELIKKPAQDALSVCFAREEPHQRGTWNNNWGGVGVSQGVREAVRGSRDNNMEGYSRRQSGKCYAWVQDPQTSATGRTKSRDWNTAESSKLATLGKQRQSPSRAGQGLSPGPEGRDKTLGPHSVGAAFLLESSPVPPMCSGMPRELVCV